MSEKLAQLEKKGGGKSFYLDQAVTNYTTYTIDCGFKPNFCTVRFHNASNLPTNIRVMDRSKGLNYSTGIWSVGSSGSGYINDNVNPSNAYFTDNGVVLKTDGGSMTGYMEVIACE